MRLCSQKVGNQKLMTGRKKSVNMLSVAELHFHLREYACFS